MEKSKKLPDHSKQTSKKVVMPVGPKPKSVDVGNNNPPMEKKPANVNVGQSSPDVKMNKAKSKSGKNINQQTGR